MTVEIAVDSGVDDGPILSTFRDIKKRTWAGRQVDYYHTQLLGYSYTIDIKGQLGEMSIRGWAMSTRCLLLASYVGWLSTCLLLVRGQTDAS